MGFARPFRLTSTQEVGTVVSQGLSYGGRSAQPRLNRGVRRQAQLFRLDDVVMSEPELKQHAMMPCPSIQASVLMSCAR